MSPKYQTVEELRDALQTAEVEMESNDQAINNLTSETAPEVVEEIRAEFKHNLEQVAFLKDAVDRKEQMAAVKAQRPGQEEKEQKPSAFGGAHIGIEPMTYRAQGPWSFFKDVLYATKEGDPGSQARLARHMTEMRREGWVMDTTSSSGLGFVAPQYLQAEWAALARAGRPFADAIGARPLPAAGVNFNIPVVTTGATVPVQTGGVEGGVATDSTPVAGTVSLSVETVAGKVDMSRQAFDRSDPALEGVIFQDLSAAYALSVDSEIINGPGSGGKVKGVLAATGINAVTYTQATPTAATLYPKIADGIQRIDTSRYLPADLIVMHPRRWASLLAALDSSNRPLVVPNPAGASVNTMAEQGQPNTSQGFVGYMQGVEVLKDANIPTTQGAGTNQDAIIVCRKEDLYLFESQGGPTIKVYEEVLSGTLQVRILAYGYIAFTAERFPKAVSALTGTGLVAPAF